MSLNPTLLALDTATEICSVALLHQGELLTATRDEARIHAKAILPMIEQLLSQAGLSGHQLDALVYSAGPGSFTGLRIAASVTQGLAYGFDKPAIAVSTLQALAQGLYDSQQHPAVLTALDARMAEVYWGVYQYNAANGLMQAQQADGVVAPDAAVIDTENKASWVAVGPGFAVYHSVLTRRFALAASYPNFLSAARNCLPAAKIAYAEGQVLAADAIRPVYCRNQVTRSDKN